MFGFAREDRTRVGVDRRRDDGFDERGHDRFGRRAIDRPVERDDAAEGGHGVGVAGAHVGVGGRRADRGAARIRVLDHGGRRLVELEHDARGRVEIEQVRVRQLLALQDRRGAEAGGGSRIQARAGSHIQRPVPRRALMRVLAVSQIPNLLERQIEAIPERCVAGRTPLECVALQIDRRKRRAIAVSYAPVCANALRISSKRNARRGVSSSASSSSR